MPTIKQKIAVKKIIENRGNVSKSMREAGYTESSAKNPSNLTDSAGYKEAAKPFLEKLEAERDRILEAMSIKKLDEVGYNHLSEALVRTTHDMQLLGGKPTEIIQDAELDEQLEAIRARRRAIESARAGVVNKEAKDKTGKSS